MPQADGCFSLPVTSAEYAQRCKVMLQRGLADFRDRSLQIQRNDSGLG